MLTREIVFQISGKDGEIMPTVPQYGGVRGEHNAAKLSVAVIGGLIGEGDTVRLSFTLGDGSVVSSDILENVVIDGDKAAVSYPLPQLLTQTAGQLCVRLVISSVDETGAETVTFRSPEMTVWFEDASLENGTPFWTGVSELLVRTSAASSAAITAQETAGTFAQSAATASAAAQNAIRDFNAKHPFCYKGENSKEAIGQLTDQTVGDVWFETVSESFVMWSGTEWVTLGASGATAEQAKKIDDTATALANHALAATKLFDSKLDNSGHEANKYLATDENGNVVTADAPQDGITPHIGENNNWYIGETDTGVKASGEDGDDGSSVTVISVTESAEDGGENVVTFSDGTKLTVKNGKTGDKGDSYTLTDADKEAIAEKVPLVTTPSDPLYAAGVSEMTDTSAVYVNTETGTLWRYQEATYDTTLTDVIAMDDADNPAYDGYYVSKGELTARAGTFVTPYINIGKYSGQIALKVKGTTCLSDTATNYNRADLCDENRNYEDCIYMCLAQQTGAYVVTTLCDSLDKVTVDGDTTTFIIDLPRTFLETQIHYIRFTCGEYGSSKTSADAEISIEYQATVTGMTWVDSGIVYAPTVTEADKAEIVQEVAALVDTELLSILGDGEVTV